MTTWILLVSLWSGSVTEFHYFGAYTSHGQCDRTAERIQAVTKAPEASMEWVCVEVPK